LKPLSVLALCCALLLSNLAMAACSHILEEVKVQNVCTKIKTFKSETMTKEPILLIALHGDSPFNNPSYQYRFASQIANKSENVISVGMLRPGYTDHLKRTSDGIKGNAVGDNYDATRIEQIAKAIQKLKSHHNASKVILSGHSGGAAITAKLIAIYPKLASHAFVVSCPCDINAWRADMYKKSQYAGFDGKLDVSSPTDLVSRVSDETKISIFVGDKDDIAKPYLSKKYEKALRDAGKQVHLAEIHGDHNLFLNKEIIKSIIDVVGDYNKALELGS
jgi:predicted esterase